MRNAPSPPPGERRAARLERAAREARTRHGTRRWLAALAVGAVAAIAFTLVVAPLPSEAPAQTTVASGSATAELQTLRVHGGAEAPPASGNESYVATTGVETLIAGGSNHDWARLVLIDGGWPLTDDNVEVILRWMRQENGPDNWWNRNNPLNNGHGSGGGSGLGSYDSLVTAAAMAAENLQLRSFYVDIVAALERGDDADATARAIWASPWASSHYGNGSHWSTAPVPVVAAPADAW